MVLVVIIPALALRAFFLGRWGLVGVGRAGNGGNGAKDRTLRAVAIN